MEQQIKVAPYKSGRYIGKVLDNKNDRSLFEVLSVLKHPNQGDLHHPKQVEGVYFHERKALAYREKVWIPNQLLQPYDREIPPYEESLKEAVNALRDELEKMNNDYGKKSLETLAKVVENYSFE
ncbi:sporulation phosphorelay system protein KapB [Aliibacillus thermotolerans]|uniref:Sporulation phosphorelay system protein KapB n=1 Tax=Aliibacillus thermotolerans TaxID=1834418 RepID=A0ABW0U462_9BACI|nr:sporulation phosphorelay system protein KapB [Aliibacillus thermotolerans]MDA3130136.1 kinase [Aliibacillus thermotolerans]